MNELKSINFHYYGYQKCKSGHFYGSAVRGQYLVHFVINGKGIYRVHGTVYQVSKNQAFLIRPGDVTFYKADETNPWEYVWLAFDGAEADRMISLFFPEQNSFICQAERAELLSAYLQHAISNFAAQDCSRMELAGWFYLFFSCLKQKDSRPPGNEKKFFEAAVNYIRYNYMNDININEISSGIGIDRTYLYKIIKKYRNCSPKEYLTRQRISASKDMLLYSEKSITDIALLCGFHDSSSFCRVFRRSECLSPSQFRKGNG